MRFVGAESPPCARCLKSNRECVVRLPNRQQIGSSAHSRYSPGRSSVSTSLRRSNGVTAGRRPAAPGGSGLIGPTAANIVTNLLTPQATLDQYRIALYRLSDSEIPSIFCTSAITIATRSVTGSEARGCGRPGISTWMNGPNICVPSNDMSEPVSRAAVVHLGEL